MFQQPSHPNAFARIAKWAIAALLALSLLSAGQNARLELRCGAACQKITSGQEF